MKKALITGINGQVGPYLAKYLLDKDYFVYGMVRQSSHPNLSFINEFKLNKNFDLCYGDLTDDYSIRTIIENCNPDIVYNLAAVSHPGISFDQPEITTRVNGTSVLCFLDIVKKTNKNIKFCQIGSSDMFAGTKTSPQNEDTPFSPLTPYGAAKCFGHNIGKIYREAYGLYVTNLICYGHESPRRSTNFVVGKVTDYVARYSKAQDLTPLSLGNLSSKRDWGDVPSFVEAMYLSMQIDKPDDYVLGTGQVYSVRDLCKTAFNRIGVELDFIGSGENEIGVDKNTNKIVINVDKNFYRPLEPRCLVADPSKANKILGWRNKMDFSSIISWLVDTKCSSLR